MCVGIICVILSLLSCASNNLGTVGALPNNWWEQPRGVIERVLRQDSTGYYSKVIVFVGISDSVKNYSESQALDFAKLDADAKLSEYIIDRTTAIIRESVDNQLLRTTDDNAEEEIKRIVEEVSNNMKSSISVAQFSSYMIEGNHTEKTEESGISYYKGWVCCTIQDDIVKTIQEIQKEAFETVISATAAYAPILQKIQEDSSLKISEVMLMDLSGDS